MSSNLTKPKDMGFMHNNSLRFWINRISYILFGLLLLYAVLGRQISYFKPETALPFLGIIVFVLFLWFNPSANRFLGHILSTLHIVRWYHVFFLALFLRVVWVLVADAQQASDMAVYEQMAVDVHNGKYFFDPLAMRPIGPSLFYAMIYALFGHSPLVAQVVVASAGAAMAILVYRLTWLITENHSASILASLLMAVMPESIFYSSLLGTDVLFATLVLLSVCFLAEGDIAIGSASKVTFFVLAGLCLGLSHWVRGTAPLFFVAAIGWVLLKPINIRQKATWSTLIVIPYFLLLLPILIHNWTVLHVFSPSLPQSVGHVLLIGTNLEHKGQHNKDDINYLKDAAKHSTDQSSVHPTVLQKRIALQKLKERLREQFWPILQMALTEKIFALWGERGGLGWSLNYTRISGTTIWRLTKRFTTFWHMTLTFVAGIGILLVGIRGKVGWHALLAFFVAAILTTSAHMFLECSGRYHHMFVSLLCVGAAFFAQECTSSFANLKLTP